MAWVTLPPSDTSLGCLFDSVSMVGVEKVQGGWIVGHLTATQEFLPFAGPFSVIEETAVTFIGAVARTDAMQAVSSLA